MRWTDVTEVLDALERAGVRCWVAGGWGVALLVGEQTRSHRDLDLAVDAEDVADCLAALEELGYSSETDELPLRVELAAEGERWVDVHPVRFDETASGVQGDADGTHFEYPPAAFTTGRLDGREVPCLSVDQQLAFHAGYAPRPQDRHDLRQLRGVTDRRV